MHKLKEDFQIYPAFNLAKMTNGSMLNAYDAGFDKYYCETKLLMTIEEWNSFNLDNLTVDIYPTVSESCPIVSIEDQGTDGKRKVVLVRTKGINGPYYAQNLTVPTIFSKPYTITGRTPKKIYHDYFTGVFSTVDDFKQTLLDCTIICTLPELKQVFDFWLTKRGGVFGLNLPNIITDTASNYALSNKTVQITELTSERQSPSFWKVSYTLRLA